MTKEKPPALSESQLRTLKTRKESYLPAANEGLHFPKDNDFYEKQALQKMMGDAYTLRVTPDFHSVLIFLFR